MFHKLKLIQSDVSILEKHLKEVPINIDNLEIQRLRSKNKDKVRPIKIILQNEQKGINVLKHN